MGKWVLKYLKIVLQNESNMPYYFLCDCQSNTKNIFAKFYKNIPKLSQEIEKKTENVLPPYPPPPPPKKKSKQSQAKDNTSSHKVFQSHNHHSIMKNICAKFYKKSNGSQEIVKKYHKTEQKKPQNGLRERSTCCGLFCFSAVSIKVIQKTSLLYKQTSISRGTRPK